VIALNQSGRNWKKTAYRAASVVFIAVFGACSTFHQPGKESVKIYSRIYLTDYNTAWQAALEALKPFDRTVQNRQAGLLQTTWIENTAQKNFIDSFGDRPTYMKAKYRLRMSLSPGHYNGRPSVKVSIQKEQMVQRDALEGWNEAVSDSVEENTMLYRVGRIIFSKVKLKKMEEQRIKDVLDQGV